MTAPHLDFETAAVAAGARRVAGVDEVGRGPLAGPVTAAAVVLPATFPTAFPAGLNDSKKVPRGQREALAEWIMTHCDWSVVHVSVEEIDRLNILHAAHLAMVRAVAGLRHPPDHVLIDGNRIPAGLNHPAQAIVRGDAQCLSIAAASILAKVIRDRLMLDLAQQHPGYGWEANAGYPTLAHKHALETLGVTPHHRRSFGPVYNILCKG